MSEHASSSVNISAITAADALDKLRITNIFRKLTSADVERVRRLLFRRCNDSVLPCARGKTTLRPIFMIREQDNDRIKRLCVSKFKVRVDSVCVAATSQHGLQGDIHVEGEGKIAVVVDGLILGVAPHAGSWVVSDLLPHFKPGLMEWRGALDYRAWDPGNLRKCTRLAENLAKCCLRQLDVSGDSLECRWRKRRRED
jgi:hypothetical protein